jgi:nucleoid DNA-binding protein
MDWRSNKGKSKLIRELMAKGFSVRKAEKAVNAIFSLMGRAVYRGEIVEIPGGTIQPWGREGKPHGHWHRFRNIATGKIQFRYVKYPGERRVIKFKPDLSLDLTPPPPPPRQLTPEEAEARRLASEILGRAADEAIMGMLENAMRSRPYKPGSMVRRLRELKARGRACRLPEQLAEAIADLYWI